MWLLNFDWISPLLAAVQDVAHGGGFTFVIPEDCGQAGRAIARGLNRRGVKTWGLMIVNRQILVTVPHRQARYAARLLLRAGLPLETIPAGTFEQPAPARTGRRAGARRCRYCGVLTVRGLPKCPYCGSPY